MRKSEDSEEPEYFVKFKDYSYIHLEWVTIKILLDSKTGKNKMNRFNRSLGLKKGMSVDYVLLD